MRVSTVTLIRPAALALCAGLLAAPASASIMISNVQVPYSEAVTLHDGILGAGNTDNIGIAGQIVLTTNLGTLYTWCVDLFHTINIGGSYTYDAMSFVSDNSGSSPGTSNPMTASQLNDIGFIAAYGNTLMATTPSNDWSAAIQAEIWDIEYHTTATGSGSFTTDLAALDALLAAPHCCYGGYQIGNQNDQAQYINQNLYVPTGPNNNTGVPEPITLALFGTGLAGLSFLRRRKVD